MISWQGSMIRASSSRRPQKISHFAQFLTRIGAVKTKVEDWRQLFWETAHHPSGD
jgi:hypothetical protein